MKIAVVNNFFPPRPGGSSHLADNLARAYVASGHEVLVLTAQYANAPSDELRDDGVRVLRLKSWTLPKTRLAANFDIGFTLSPTSIRQVAEALSDFKPDVIHQHGQFFDLTWQSGVWARRNKVPTLLSIHTRLENPINKFNSAIYHLADRILVTPLMRLHKPSLVVMDRLMQKYVRSRYRRSYSDEFAIPVGIDVNFAQNGNRPAGRTFIGIEEDTPLILSVGHVIPQRSRIALVEALPFVLSAIPNARVFIAGGLYYSEFLKKAQQLQVSHAIIAPGAVQRSLIPNLLAAADLEVHELQGEGIGTASLEALAAGVPVIAAATADNFLNLEIRDGYEMHLVPFGPGPALSPDPQILANKIIEILNSPDRARTISKKYSVPFARENFSLASVANQHIDVLTKLVLEQKKSST